MKNYIFPLVLFFALLSCEEENPTIYRVDPSIEPYVAIFYDEAEERGVVIPRNLVAEFKPVQAITKGETAQGQNYLYVDKFMFDNFNDSQREAQIVYRLAGVFFHTSEPGLVGLMSEYDRESAFDSFVDNP